MSELSQRTQTGSVLVQTKRLLEFGGRLDRFEVGYRLYGDRDRPLIVALGGISAGRHIAACAEEERRGWWEELVGDGLAIDTRRYSVLGIDWLGGSGASTNAAPGFPLIGTRDQACALVAVLDQLEIERARAIVGASYGGMVALACAVHFPERIGRSLIISAAHRTHPMATALRSLQRDIVRLGLETGRVAESLRIARGIAMTTYRTIEEFRDRFDAGARWSREGARFPVQEYLDNTGRRFAASFSPESLLCLSESIDLHRIEPTDVRTPTALVAVSGDTLVPPWQMEELRDALQVETRWRVVTSIYGHDAFLKEVPAMSSAIMAGIE